MAFKVNCDTNGFRIDSYNTRTCISEHNKCIEFCFYCIFITYKECKKRGFLWKQKTKAPCVGPKTIWNCIYFTALTFFLLFSAYYSHLSEWERKKFFSSTKFSNIWTGRALPFLSRGDQFFLKISCLKIFGYWVVMLTITSSSYLFAGLMVLLEAFSILPNLYWIEMKK